MANGGTSPPQRLVLAYRREGFQRIGGLQRIAEELVAELQSRHPQLSLATLTASHQGQLNRTQSCQRLRSGDQLLIVGCDSGWAYGLALLARLRGLPVGWLPSFHDPAHTIHQHKARLAQLALQWLQGLGVVVFAQTQHEQGLLQSQAENQCRVSGHGLPARIRTMLLSDAPQQRSPERPIDLLFLGRPTAQKGWPQFLELAQATSLRCEAIVPMAPQPPPAITLHHQPSDQEVQVLLHKTKLVIIPANYESFGIAQLEALAAGCVLPILGHWRLWNKCPVLQWQSFSRTHLVAQCEQICSDPIAQQRLQSRQWDYLRHHPVVSTPILPRLL
jgi:glycosyltransferase involved in cell wall biosynthesis